MNIPAVLLTGQNAPPPGTIILFEADVTSNDGTQVLNRGGTVVKATRALDVELDPRPQPVAQGDDLHYTITFGNRGMTMVTGPMLVVPLPLGTTFGSASDGGQPMDDRVEWTLDDLPNGAGGTRELVLHVDPSAVEGTPLVAHATLSGAGAESRAQSVARVQEDVPLTVTISAAPDPVTPGQTLIVSLTVKNDGTVPLFNVAATIRVPPEVTPFPTNQTTGGALCNAGATFACDNLELVHWTLGDARGRARGDGHDAAGCADGRERSGGGVGDRLRSRRHGR